MQNRFLPKFIITIIITLCVFCFVGLLFAKNKPVDPAARNIPNELQEQAREYRQAGLENQRMGNLPAAMSLYQKAIAIDPGYAVAYNDLGVIYEAANFPERAEESYLKSIKIDPDYLSAYANLALFYENQRDLEKAAYYWAKRAGSGLPDDPWTQRAASRLKDIRLVLSSKPIADQREKDVIGLMKDAAVYKSVLNKDDAALAQARFSKAKQSYNKGDLATAVKEALDAQYLDQNNPEIEVFIEKAVLRALSH
jgi:Flp pilus assembly protein TadD